MIMTYSFVRAQIRSQPTDRIEAYLIGKLQLVQAEVQEVFSRSGLRSPPATTPSLSQTPPTSVGVAATPATSMLQSPKDSSVEVPPVVAPEREGEPVLTPPTHYRESKPSHVGPAAKILRPSNSAPTTAFRQCMSKMLREGLCSDLTLQVGGYRSMTSLI
jgi:hypothetical protein